MAIGLKLCREGVCLVLNDISEERVQYAAQAIAKEGGVCLACAGDAGDLGIVNGLVDRAVKTYGRIDFCIANAGLTHFDDFFAFSPEQFKAIMDLNLNGAFFLSQAAARRMRDMSIPGKILLMSSNVGLQTYPQLTAYSMSKAALQMMARSLVLELSPFRITINALAPGATLTPRTLKDDPNYERHWRELIPLQKVATPEAIAEVAFFMLSPAADHITGQTIVIDGGWSQKGHYPPPVCSTSKIVEAES